MSRALALVASIGLAVALPSTALAHPLVDEGVRRFEEAELEAARDVLTRAEASEGLTREDVVRLYETRALCNAALGDADAMDADLARLAALAPDHRLNPAAPPEMVSRFEAHRARGVTAPPVAAEASMRDGRIVVTAGLRGDDPLRLVRRVRVGARGEGEPAYRLSDGAELVLDEGLASPIAYFAEGVGAGGVVLSSDGSADDPHLFRFGDDGGGIDETALFIGLGIGGGVVVLAAIVIIIAVAVGSAGYNEETQVRIPEI
ncbi:MAG: hypothetical protein AB7S26_03830 [Sandaracinaceae bacterium]